MRNIASHVSATQQPECHGHIQECGETTKVNHLVDQPALGAYSALRKENLALQLQLEAEREVKNRHSQNVLAIQNRMQALLNFLPGGIVVLNEKGRVIQSNPAAEIFLGEGLLGKLWRNIITECFSPRNDDGFEVSTKRGRRLSISTSSLGQNGQIVLLTDQTETRRLQENVSRNERLSAMGKTVSALAHQIRTPLSAALLYANHLCDDNLSEEVKRTFAKKNLSRLRHMEKQVRDMMLFVKSELPLNDIVCLQQFENELKAAAEVAIQASNIDCIWINDVPEMKLKCHLEALVSAMMNLITNAIQSYADAGNNKQTIKIHLRSGTSKSGHSIFMDVIDYGEGMDSATLEQIQEVFTTTKSHGTGLGLAVVRSVAKAHGAQLTISSEPTVGTLASLAIPSFIEPETN